MCLYPKLIINPKYKPNKKNGGHVPPIKDKRVLYVPIGCNKCLECKKQKSRTWTTRLTEEIAEHKNGKFVTLTFSTESLIKLKNSQDWVTEEGEVLEGYQLENAIVTKAVRLFLERWRKKHKKSVRHWLITELGDGHTEHIHLHGIVWCNDLYELEQIWQYGYVWKGNYIKGKYINYVSERTINYMMKYVTKPDEKHLAYDAIILCSPGIGGNYTKRRNALNNVYAGPKTNTTYKTKSGSVTNLPIYYRNKLYTEEQREKLWIAQLDRNKRYVCGIAIDADDLETYNNVLEHARMKSAKLGYKIPDWDRVEYEHKQRQIIQIKRGLIK